MKTTLIALAILGSLTLPAAAQARVSRAELHRDNRAVAHERHEMVRAARHGNYHRAREEHRELNFARHERRDDRREFAQQHRHH